MIIFVGDYVRPVGSEGLFEVRDTDGDMQIRLEDGRWCWADEGDIDCVMSSKEYWEAVGHGKAN